MKIKRVTIYATRNGGFCQYLAFHETKLTFKVIVPTFAEVSKPGEIKNVELAPDEKTILSVV